MWSSAEEEGDQEMGSGDELISEEVDEEVAVQEWPGVEGGGRDRSQDMDEVAAVVIEGILMGDNGLDVGNDDDGTSETTNTNSQ